MRGEGNGGGWCRDSFVHLGMKHSFLEVGRWFSGMGRALGFHAQYYVIT